MRGQLQAKIELGESLHAVDFEQLEIENKHLKEAIEQKNGHLLELKRMNGSLSQSYMYCFYWPLPVYVVGTANFVLNNHKQYLNRQVQELNKIKKEIEKTDQKIVAMDDESDLVEKCAKQAHQKSQEIDKLMKSYTVLFFFSFLLTVIIKVRF